jgi:purine-binding chemotaxis protein CheW
MSECTAEIEEVTQPESTEGLSQFLTFHVCEDRFAVGILDVQEIIENTVITKVPMTPDFIKGVINLRGSVVPVVDLASRLERGVGNITKRSCIVLVDVGVGEESQTIGMLVDEVNEILEIPEENMQPAPDFGTDIRTDFIQHMARVGDEIIVLLEVCHVMSVEEIADLMQLKDELQGSNNQDATSKGD